MTSRGLGNRGDSAAPGDGTRGPARGSGRGRFLDALNWESRRTTAFLGMLNRAVAGQVKLNTTDIETLGVLAVVGTATPTRLAALLTMGTGSMTLVIDRLERAGYVRRVRDTQDRRSLTVEIVQQSAREIAAIYAPLQERAAEIAQRYDEDQLAVIVDYLTRSNDMLRDVATGLTQLPDRQAEQDP
jgi:DNA-binding MarR family transcriptional regulator